MQGRKYFFFQAEDGIRDLTVTGVQTCALPISRRASWCFCFAVSFGGRTDAGRARRPAWPWRRCARFHRRTERRLTPRRDRKSGVEGKRGELGGGRII